MTWLLDGRPVERALVTRLRYLGDIVMSTVVVRALRRGDPGLDIGYLCEESHAPVLAGHPDLSRVHALSVHRRGADAQARRSTAGIDAGARGTVGTIAALRTYRYDIAVDLFFNPRSAWLLRLAGIPGRLAGPAGSRTRLYTHASDATAVRELAGWDELAPGGLGDHLARLAPLVHRESGLPFSEWFVREGERARTYLGPRPSQGQTVARRFAAAGLDARAPYVVLAPGATWPTKQWPTEHWRRLQAGLLERWPGSCVTLTPPGGDPAAGAERPGSPGRAAALPPLGLPDVLDILAGATAVVSVDGGVMHAAVGLGTPTLALFGPTDPRLWFPYGPDGAFRVLATRPACHPCDRHDCDAFICLPDLGPDSVLEEACALLSAASTRNGGALS